MKKTKSETELKKIIGDIITNTEDNVYFTHITGLGLSSLYLVEGQGILTTEELLQKGYNPYEFDDNKVDAEYLEYKEFLKNNNLNTTDEWVFAMQEKYYKEATKSFFERGLYSENPDIRHTATELRSDDIREQLLNLVSREKGYMNQRGNMTLVLEVPKEYIYGDKKGQLFQEREPMEGASGAHMHSFTQAIASKFIKAAIITERTDENIYFIVENEKQREKGSENEGKGGITLREIEDYIKSKTKTK